MKTQAALVIAMAVCLYGQSPEADIRAGRRASTEAIHNHDLKAFAASLDSDFVMIRGNGVFVPTREAYVDLLAKDFADAKAVQYQRITDRVEISNAAPVAAEHGHWVGTKPDGSRAYSGTYLAMWRKTQYGWKIRSELYVVLECGDANACGSSVFQSKDEPGEDPWR